MLHRSLFLGAVFALCGSRAVAVPVRIALDWPVGTPSSAHVHIRAIQMAGNTDTAAPVETEASGDGVELELGYGVWRVQASALGYWSEENEVAVDRQSPASARIVLWPAASLHGEVVPTPGEPLPTHLELRLDAAPAPTTDTGAPKAVRSQREPSPSHAKLRCPIHKGSWNCFGPAGVFDIQIVAADYVPRYEWGVSLRPAASTGLGPTELRRAASVSGRAVQSNGSDSARPCRATLEPDIERRGVSGTDAEITPAADANFSVDLNRRGYFQFVGIPPSKYALTVQCPSASGFRSLRVQADTETRIDPPLQLEELTLDIAVTPTLDPDGKPWQLTVDQTAPRSQRLMEKAPTSADGRVIRRGLMAGNYRISVSGSDGSLWLQRYLNLGPGSRPLSLRLSSLRVSGRLLLKSQPVRARLVFSNDAGGESVSFNSDDTGRFRGLLPISPSVQETRWTVEAHLAHPPSDRIIRGVHVVTGASEAWLDLELPAMSVRGSVISEDGNPQRGTQVTFEESRGNRTTTGTDDEGRFEMPDLPPGKYTAVADSPEGVSDRIAFDVAEGSESELKLIVHPSMRIAFYVISSDGPVYDAAVQAWMAPGVPQAFTRTDQNGRFELYLLPETKDVALTIGAPGYGLKLLRLAISNDNKVDQASDATTITLGRSGGRLVLDFQPPQRPLDSSATLYLVHKGAIQDARTVAGWGTEQAGSSADEPVEVEMIEPGDYALCAATGPAELSALWRGALPPNRCRTGLVEDGRTLTLSPP